MNRIETLIDGYTKGQIVGWLGAVKPWLVQQNFALISSGNYSGILPSFQLKRTLNKDYKAGQKTQLWRIVRAIFGKDIPNIPQEIGDCLSRGALVKMSDGSQKPIEDVQVGERVFTDQICLRKVIRTIKKPYSGPLLTLSTNFGSVICTPDHRLAIYKNSEVIWEEAKNLRVGDYPLHNNKLTKIEESQHKNIFVYCLEVERDHSFFANGFVVSNCVSWAARNTADVLQFSQKEKGQRIKYRPTFPPWYYGTSRVYVGRAQLGNEDGSLGAWMSEAAQKYGSLFMDEPGVPPYSGNVAKQWGDPDKRDIDGFKNKAAPFCIKSCALVRTWNECVQAISNGYPLHTCSIQGYNMEPSSDGFHRRAGRWGHAMSVISIHDSNDPYVEILNSWGDVHSRLQDFDDRTNLPVGILRVRRKDFEYHLAENETYAWSNGDFFEEQDLEKYLFDLIGEQTR